VFNIVDYKQQELYRDDGFWLAVSRLRFAVAALLSRRGAVTQMGPMGHMRLMGACPQSEKFRERAKPLTANW